jgi:hypothetical protein
MCIKTTDKTISTGRRIKFNPAPIIVKTYSWVLLGFSVINKWRILETTSHITNAINNLINKAIIFVIVKVTRSPLHACKYTKSPTESQGANA